jgi:hypothetical protein
MKLISTRIHSNSFADLLAHHPEYMMIRVAVNLDELNLSDNGKELTVRGKIQNCFEDIGITLYFSQQKAPKTMEIWHYIINVLCVTKHTVLIDAATYSILDGEVQVYNPNLSYEEWYLQGHNVKEEKIGIFWLYQNTIIEKSKLAINVNPDSLGLRDVDFQHIDAWEHERIYMPKFLGLMGSEYQELPRGRVIYSDQKNKFIIYADKACLTEQVKTEILCCFKLEKVREQKRVTFRVDPHYRTNLHTDILSDF